MKAKIFQRPRIVVDIIVELEGAEFYLEDLKELFSCIDSKEIIRIEDPLYSQLLSLRILASPGDDSNSPIPGKRYRAAKKALAEAIGEDNIFVPLAP